MSPPPLPGVGSRFTAGSKSATVWELWLEELALDIETLCSKNDVKKVKMLASAAKGDPSKAKEAPHERSMKNKYFLTVPEKNRLTAGKALFFFNSKSQMGARPANSANKWLYKANLCIPSVQYKNNYTPRGVGAVNRTIDRVWIAP